MPDQTKISNVTRRHLLQSWLAAGSTGLAFGLFAPPIQAQGNIKAATPACGPDSGPTRTSTEGPFYSEDPPEKRDFRADVDAAGAPVTLIGYVLTRDCQPVRGAIVDLWHADQDGAYDNQGFKLRGYQRTDDQGRYYFETIRPAEYVGRTPHYHVKIRPPAGDTLTTQLYFPDEPRNQRDFLFHPALLMQVERDNDGVLARFDFVLA